MQPYNLNPGPESLRWLGIAEKLLQTRDLIGSITFATRARESNPRLEHADQILAIADTLIAGEKQINNNHLDWYAILQLARRTHDSELIASKYRRLALLLNPNRNKFPFAEHAFKLVSEACADVINLLKDLCAKPGLGLLPEFIRHHTFGRAAGLGYRARRALRALRGLVRLKLLIQGQSVKRQATTTLRCMQTLARVQSQIRTRRLRMSEENQDLQRQLLQKHEKEVEKLRASMGEDWNDSAQSKEQVETNIQNKQEAAIRRERALAYAYSHQINKRCSDHILSLQLRSMLTKTKRRVPKMKRNPKMRRVPKMNILSSRTCYL